MIAPQRLILLVAAGVALSGCCRETLHLLTLDTKAPVHAQHKRKAVADDEREKAAVKGAEAAGAQTIETGSIPDRPDCQGEHIAYQATKEYLKNFGPKPPDLPGEQGPCRAGK